MDGQSTKFEVVFAFARDDENPLEMSEDSPLTDEDIEFIENLFGQYGLNTDRSRLNEQIIESEIFPATDENMGKVDEIMDKITDQYSESNVSRGDFSSEEYGVPAGVFVTSVSIEELPDNIQSSRN